MSVRRIGRAGMVAVAVAVLAGCGGGGGGAAPTTSAPTTTAFTKNALIKATDDYCQQFISLRANDAKQFQSQHPNPDPAAARDFVVNTLSPLYDSLIGAMHRVTQPSTDAIAWLRLVDSMDTRVSDWKQSIDQDPVGHVTSDPFSDMAQRFTDFGFTVCNTL